MIFFYLFLFLAGLGAGFINSLAGGGSSLTITVLIMLGLDSTLANTTNRIGVLFQNASALYNFNKHLDLTDEIKNKLHITLSAVVGGIFGSFTIMNTNTEIFDKILIGVFIFMIVIMFKPKKKIFSKTIILPKFVEAIIFFTVGFYGGFIQLGIGFILLMTLNLIEDYNLIKANAFKVLIIFCYSIPVVIIFAIKKQIVWKYGLMISSGMILGSYIGVKLAIKKGTGFVKGVVGTAMIISILKLVGFFDLFIK